MMVLPYAKVCSFDKSGRILNVKPRPIPPTHFTGKWRLKRLTNGDQKMEVEFKGLAGEWQWMSEDDVVFLEADLIS